MPSDASEPFPSHPASEEPAAKATTPSPPLDDVNSLPKPHRTDWKYALLAGLVAGIISGIGGELVWPKVRAAQTPRIIPYPTAEDYEIIIAGQAKSTEVSFFQEGAVLGAVLGLAGGLCSRSVRRGLFAGVVGMVLAGAIAAGAAHWLLPVYYRNVDPQGHDLTLPVLTHGGIWLPVGAMAGLAFGLGLGGRARWARGALGGFLGAVVATMAYEAIGAVAFPLDKTHHPVPATVVTRLFAQLTVAVLVAMVAAMGAGDAPRRAPPAA
jgi:hypothetical protein